ncbi:MAG: hypothetical protein D3923_01345 [Candidatus Electrothrix sp. AR3]|nr:hypothetical protein [Candidatus Electrothrix sp. AR3]
MDTPAQYCQVAVSNIDLTDTQYSLHPFPIDPAQHLDSLSSLLYPPLLLECLEKQYIVLSGKEYILVEEKQDKTLLALVIPSLYAEQQRLIFELLIRHRLLRSSLSNIEQAIFCQKASKLLPAEEVIAFLPLLGLKAKPHIRDQLLSLLALEHSVQFGLHTGSIAPRVGKKLGFFSPADQEILALLIEELRLGGSKQQKLIDSVFELTRRQQISAQELLQQWQEREQAKQQNNGPQKITSLFSWLNQACQPRLTAAEEEFKKFCGQLKLPSGIRVSHSPAFEEQQVTLSIDFTTQKELATAWSKIHSALDNN